MEKLIAILLTMLIILALAFGGCNTTFGGCNTTFGGCNTTKSVDDRNAPSEMTVIDETAGYIIYKHDKTGVCYFCVIGSEGRSACVMLNPDGTPYMEGNTDEK